MFWHDVWNSIDRLARLVTFANWGIAASLLFGFAFTVVAIKAGGRKDELVAVEDLKKAQQIADTMKLAGDANEKANELEHDNLKLRGQVATLETNAADAKKDVAGLQKTAADAKTTQQKVEIELAKQQQRAAEAEHALLELQERIKDRHLTAEKRAELVALLAANPKGDIAVSCVGGHPEPCKFAAEIVDALKEAGWTVTTFMQGVMYVGSSPAGLMVQVQKVEEASQRAVVLQRALERIGFPCLGQLLPSLKENAVNLIIGSKP